MTFAGCQGMKGLSGGKFHIDAHAVSQIANLLNDLRSGSGDGFGMNIAAEMVFGAQQLKTSIHKFHGIGRCFYDAGA